MKPPVVSVICSVCNGQRFLRHAVYSILHQSFSDFELILIDDGSTDDTPHLMDSIAREDGRVRVVHQKNTGLTRALNRGLDLARGELVARQDDDDVSRPDRLARQVEYLRAHPRCAVVGARYLRTAEDGTGLELVRLPLKSADIKRALITHNVFAHSAVMFRREVVLGAGRYDESCRTAQDYQLWCRLALHHELANLSAGLLLCRDHPGQIGVVRSKEQVACRNRIRRQYRDAILAGRMKGADAPSLRRLARLHDAIDRAIQLAGAPLQCLLSPRESSPAGRLSHPRGSGC